MQNVTAPGGNRITNEHVAEAGDTAADDDAPPPKVSAEEGYRAEVNKSFRAWTRLSVPWDERFSELKEKDSNDLDLVGELMNKNVGIVYRKIMETDPKRLAYGYIPPMASS